MEHEASLARSELENMLVDETAEPKALQLSLLKDITGGFSFEQEIGRGGFALVYKGIVGGRAVAVKKLADPYMDEKLFHRQIQCLMQVKHKNAVRILGYCDEIHGHMVRSNGRFVMAYEPHRLICFEYIPKGILDKYITDKHREWEICYKIIKGICEGIQHLHDNHIIHCDLTPSNILLDDNMSPKISGFGMSRCFDENQSQHITRRCAGTIGYCPPEFLEDGIITRSTDLYSLGVIIIEMLTQQRWCQAIEEVLKSWSDRLERSQRDILCKQIQVCYEIALECIDRNPKKRPHSAQNIIDRLRGNEMRYELSHLSYLKEITNYFSEERILGKGGSGVVYKGELQNGKVIAVKKVETMCSSKELCEKSKNLFENEVALLVELKHPNIVQLLGYCYEMKHVDFLHGRKFCWQIDTLLCLEFLPKESLYNYISDATSGLDWCTRYKTIEGISYGLQYLHEQPVAPIIHLDLKPANILFDANMVPKITDFGISRLFDQGKTIHTLCNDGTPGYMPPEYILRGPITRDTIRRGIITPMSDIFSLGVMIMEVITGHRDYPYDINEDSSKEYINTELGKWRTRLEKEPGQQNLQTDCKQIEKCIQIGLMCVNHDRTKRPTIRKITNMLQGLESMDC